MVDFGLHYWTVMPKLWAGAAVTVKITAIAVLMGCLIGLIMALLKMSRFVLLRVVANVYIESLRGTPLYVQILLFHLGVPQLISVITHAPFHFGMFFTAVVVCSLNSGAYVAEIFRGGIQSIDSGQMEAARSLGMPHKKAMLYVVLPQAFKRVIPPLCNEFIALLKDTSLLAVIGVTEIMKAGQIYASVTFAPFPTYLGVATVYLIMTLTISGFVNYLEKRMGASDVH